VRRTLGSPVSCYAIWRIVAYLEQIWCISTSCYSVCLSYIGCRFLTRSSLLQAIRIQWRGMADHLRPPLVGSHHLPTFHDRSILPSLVLLALHRHGPAHPLHVVVELEHVYRFRRTEQVPRAEQYLRGTKGGRRGSCHRSTGRGGDHQITKVCHWD